MSTSSGLIDKIGKFFIGSFWGLLGVLLFFFSQLIAVISCLIAKLDIDVYEGTYAFVATVVGLLLIVPLIIFRGNLSIKKNTLVFKDKLTIDTFVPVLVISMGLMGIVMVYFIVADQIANIFPKVQEEVDNYSEALDRYANIDAAEIPAFDSWLNIIASCFLVPVLEELTFRGVLLGEMLRKMPAALAIFLSALVFGLMHGLSVQIGYAFLSGLIIGFVYYTTHSIYATITLHTIFNLLGAGIDTLLDSGIFGDVSAFKAEFDAFTVYLSLLMIIPSIIAIVFLWKRHKSLKSSEILSSELLVETSGDSTEAQGE